MKDKMASIIIDGDSYFLQAVYSECSYTYTAGYSEDALKVQKLKKALKDKHLNPALKMQYSKELNRLIQ